MALVQRSRFATFFKNLTGFRGPLDLPLQEGLHPVMDILGSRNPDLDTEVGYWLLQPSSTGPTAGQFSAICAKVSSGTAIIDGFSVRAPAAQAVVRVGIGPEIPNNPVNAMSLNNYLSQRSPTFNTSVANFQVITSGSFTQVSDFFGGGNTPWNIDVPTAQFSLIFSLPGFAAITPGYAFVIAGGVANQAIGGAMWGRWLADQQ
jgi:hypothetical protein